MFSKLHDKKKPWADIYLPTVFPPYITGHDSIRQTLMLIKLKKYIKAALLKTNFSIIPILAFCIAHIEQICGKSQEKSK
jgi:hypothetical protein